MRSAPCLFNRLADAIQWILHHHFAIEHSFHYLDDFFLAGAGNSSACSTSLAHMLSLCDLLGIPLKPDKIVGPTTTMTFLGIELDTVAQQARLPPDKHAALTSELDGFVTKYSKRASCSKRSLLSLIGKLAFACKVVPAGRIFLRRLLDLAHSVKELHHHLHISREALQDVLWWRDFSQTWNGTSFFLDPTWTPASDLQIFTDASSTLGYGAFWNGAWFSHPWPSHLAQNTIEWKELYAVVMACETWGAHWSRKRILFHCDNQAIVSVWESGLSRSTSLMHLVRALFWVAANNNFTVLLRHIPGIDNSIADALSRLQLPRFRGLAPHARLHPTPTPVDLTYTSIDSSRGCKPKV